LVLEDYNIWWKVEYVTSDNHGSNNILCYELSEFLRRKDLNWRAKYHRVHCYNHIINLITQAFLFMDSKEAIEEACTQIENLDRASYDMDIIKAWKRNKDLD
jgi:hypothetical protein